MKYMSVNGQGDTEAAGIQYEQDGCPEVSGVREQESVSRTQQAPAYKSKARCHLRRNQALGSSSDQSLQYTEGWCDGGMEEKPLSAWPPFGPAKRYRQSH